MARLFTIVLLLNLLIPGQSTKAPQRIRSQREAKGLVGRVKTVEVSGGGFLEKNGGLVERCCQPEYSETYDIDGKCIEVKSDIPPVDGRPSDAPTMEETYDDQGHLVGEVAYRADRSLLSKTVHTYDDNGNPRETTIYSANGTLYRREVFTYSEGRLQEHVEYYGDGLPLYKTSYTDYDSEGNWRKRIKWSWTTIEGVRKWEPFTLTYRSLTYY